MPHTPGPWVRDAVNSEYMHDIILGYDVPGWGRPVLVATCFGENRADDINMNDAAANARLIAAAPDLLAACQLLADWDASPNDDNDVERLSNAASAARAAIAKATGGAK